MDDEKDNLHRELYLDLSLDLYPELYSKLYSRLRSELYRELYDRLSGKLDTKIDIKLDTKLDTKLNTKTNTKTQEETKQLPITKNAKLYRIPKYEENKQFKCCICHHLGLYRNKSGSRLYCNEHRSPNNTYVGIRVCNVHKGCYKAAKYTYPIKETACNACEEHKLPDMFHIEKYHCDVSNPRCRNLANCYKNDDPNKIPRRCSDHCDESYTRYANYTYQEYIDKHNAVCNPIDFSKIGTIKEDNPFEGFVIDTHKNDNPFKPSEN